jgi:cytokinesis protein
MQSLYTGVRPRKKLKPMHWEKLDGVEYTLWASRTTDKDGIFEELSKKGILEEMERLFFFKETRLLKKPKGDAEKKKEFLDTGVVKAFQIALSKYAQIPALQVVTKIHACDKDMLDNSAIMDFLQREELSTISDNLMKSLAPYAVDWTEPGADGKKREADPNELRREDLIYLETAYNLHHYWKSRVRALALTRSLDSDYTDIQTKMNQVLRVSDTVRSCKAFQDVLALILQMGNYMNDTSKQVTGFKLGTLNRLVNVKDDKNQRTFMDYIEMTVRKKFPDLEGFIDELHESVTLEKGTDFSSSHIFAHANGLLQRMSTTSRNRHRSSLPISALSRCRSTQATFPSPRNSIHRTACYKWSFRSFRKLARSRNT